MSTGCFYEQMTPFYHLLFPAGLDASIARHAEMPDNLMTDLSIPKESAMSTVLTKDLLNQYQRAISMLRATIGKFSFEQWTSGISWFQAPAKIAYHVIECLDAYFREDPDAPYTWGYRFGAPFWELPDREQPSQEALLEYLQDIEMRIERELSSLTDGSLAEPHDAEKRHAETRLGHYVYALRHTMHHHGALTLLSIYHGNEGGSWA